MRIVLLICSILSLGLGSFSQRHAVGTFYDHLPYKRGLNVEALGERVFCHSGPSLLMYDQEDETTYRLNTISGLTEMGVSAIAAHEATNTLLVGYESGTIDLIEGLTITNIDDIRRSSIIGDKRINSVYFYGDSAFINTGFGIILFSMTNTEVLGTFLIGEGEGLVDVLTSFIDGQTIYAGTPDGLYFADFNSDLSLFSNWQQIDTLSGKRIDAIFRFSNRLYINESVNEYREDTVYYKSNGNWLVFDSLTGNTNESIRVYDDRIVLAQPTGAAMYDKQWNSLQVSFDYQTGISPSPYDAVWLGERQLFIADFNQGLIKSEDAFNHQVLTPTSPSSTNNQRIFTIDDKVFITGGGRGTDWGNTFQPAEVFRLVDNEWESTNRFTTNDLKRFFDFIDVVSDDGETYYVSTLGSGLFSFTDTTLLERYTANNSDLVPLTQDSSWVGTSGLTFDNDGNLWIANTRSNKPLHVLTPNGDWISIEIPGFGSLTFTGHMLHSSSNHIWLFLPGTGILVYDYNNTVEDLEDDRYVILDKTPGNGNLPSLVVQSIAEDENGEIWVGTDAGLRVFFSPSRVFEGGELSDVSEILIQQGVYTEVLFDEENITDIEIDDANRKWIGTKGSGVFLLSPDGKTEIHHFSEANSPLFSNSINDIGILRTTGEVLIGTEQGVISYKAEATQPQSSMQDVFAYPNPVKPGYTGQIAIRGLADGAEVRITDVSGNLVYSGTSFGGQAVWDGFNTTGDRVSPGVYLVFAASSDGQARAKTKILIASH